ncbi:MAG: hypothetical protein SV253_08770 [Halobacteria archaeon]|nr:hypothetical protein [Halobacteria archaeon]
MSRRLRLLGVSLLLLIALSAVTVSVSAQNSGQTDIQIDIDDNGDADLVIDNHVSLGTQSERQAFDSILSNQTRLNEMGDEAAAPFKSFAERASQEIERNMSVSVKSVKGTRDGETGTISITLSWENFGRVDDSRVYVGDVFEGGLRLSEGQSLSVVAPEGYSLSEESVLPDGRIKQDTVTVEGPIEMNQSLRLVYTPVEDGEASNQTQDVNETQNGEQNQGQGGNGMPGFGLLAGSVALIGVAALRELQLT